MPDTVELNLLMVVGCLRMYKSSEHSCTEPSLPLLVWPLNHYFFFFIFKSSGQVYREDKINGSCFLSEAPCCFHTQSLQTKQRKIGK